MGRIEKLEQIQIWKYYVQPEYRFENSQGGIIGHKAVDGELVQITVFSAVFHHEPTESAINLGHNFAIDLFNYGIRIFGLPYCKNLKY